MSESRNIAYATSQLLEFYSRNRRTWDELYPSERWVFEHLAEGRGGSLGDVLDVGCACGGLGAALAERFALDSYTGVDINAPAVAWAAANTALPVPARFLAADVLAIEDPGDFDLVVSLSCVDWNVETEAMIARCWELVRPGGHFVASLRITDGESVSDIAHSRQRIDFRGDDPDAEVAPYVVHSLPDALALLGSLDPAPALIGAYGYWGPPSSLAVTPFERLAFSVFWVRKPDGPGGTTELDLRLPAPLTAG